MQTSLQKGFLAMSSEKLVISNNKIEKFGASSLASIRLSHGDLISKLSGLYYNLAFKKQNLAFSCSEIPNNLFYHCKTDKTTKFVIANERSKCGNPANGEAVLKSTTFGNSLDCHEMLRISRNDRIARI